ncbi:transcriptional regulator FilR1 domain-containing protein [Methanobrevibacter sp. DSM 116169]|uniref:transcriptional regulator FilR1 domain-containing protein n=1 Tax=Methanobrevibacter sp. DSM 116169 TaxID=3242727 RepID=UPI0038FCBAFA
MNYLKNQYLDDYEKVSDEIKFITNSKIRLKVMHIIFDNPLTMREIHSQSSLSYSSISSNISKLEKGGFIYRQYSKYYLNNNLKLFLINIFDFDNVLSLVLNDFSDFFIKHYIDSIPKSLIEELYLLNNSKLVENNDYDVYKTYNVIKRLFNSNDSIKAILPFIYSDFIDILKKAIKNSCEIEIILPKNIARNIKNNLTKNELKKIKLIEINSKIDFSLFVSSKNMALGLFKDDDFYDQNRLLVSYDKKGLIWAEKLFNEFKRNIN